MTITIGLISILLFLPLAAIATPPKVQYIEPPHRIAIKTTIEPARPVVGDDVVLRCQLMSEKRLDAVTLQLTVLPSMMEESTVQTALDLATGESVARYDERLPHFWTGVVISEDPVTLTIRFRATRCGFLAIPFGYSYPTPDGNAMGVEPLGKTCISARDEGHIDPGQKKGAGREEPDKENAESKAVNTALSHDEQPREGTRTNDTEVDPCGCPDDEPLKRGDRSSTPDDRGGSLDHGCAG